MAPQYYQSFNEEVGKMTEIINPGKTIKTEEKSNIIRWVEKDLNQEVELDFSLHPDWRQDRWGDYPEVRRQSTDQFIVLL